MTAYSHTERVVKDAFRYAVKDCDRLPEPRWWYSDLDRNPGFVKRLTGMVLAPGENGRSLDDSLHVPRTLGRIVLAQHAPQVLCIEEAYHAETEAQAEADVAQSLARKTRTTNDLERAYGAMLMQMVILQRAIHVTAYLLGRDTPKDSLWRAA